MKMRRFFGALLMLVFALTVVGCVSNKKYNDVAEQLNNAQTQLDAANAQLTVLEEQKAALELQQQNLNAEKAALNARIAQLEEFEGLSAELEEELAQLNEEKEALDARIAETEADLAALQELVAALSNRPVAPTSLELFLIGSTLVGTSTNAAEPDIDYVVTPAGAYTGLYFEVENPEIASVDSLGRVTGLKPGKTKINAWSTLDPSVKDSVDFEVIEAGADLDIVIAAVNEIYAQLNRSYVAEDLALIHAANPSVKISYLKGSEVIAEYVDGELTRGTGYYAYEAPAVDKLEKVTIKGEYGANNVQHNMELTLFVVADLANNAFNRVQMARDIVESYLLPYTSEVEKVSADLALEAEIAGVEIVYTSSAKQIISNAGAYVRPLDDTKVNFQVMYKYQIPGGELYTESAAYDVYANGYTAEEKMDYIVNEGSLAFLNGYASNVNINLPAADDKFDAKLTYVSDKPEVFDNAGKYANQELAEATVVTYTVSFEYRGENLGTREVAVTAKLPSVASKAANAFANDNEVPAHFPYGIKDRVGGNALPGLVATQAVGADTANVAWEALEPELWADGFVLNAQYLRFRETALKATFTNAADETDKAELELVLNIGAGKTKDDVIVAGRFSQQSSQIFKETADTLAVFSYFDPVVGVLDMAFPTYYSGYMFSIQGEFRPDPENPDAEIFYQGADASRSNIYFRHDSIIYVTGKKDNGEGIFDNSTLIQGTGGNWPVLYVNNYTETVKVPFAVHVTGNGSDGNPIVATGFSREFALTVDGYRTCFIVNLETGKVVSGNGKGGLQFAYPAGTKYLDLPANHAIYCPKTQSNNAIYNGVFCVQGTTLEVNHHDLHPKNSYFVDTANALLDNAEVSIAKLEAGEALEEGDANPAAALATANARANNARLSDAEKAGFNAAKYAELAARYAALFDVELQALKDSKGEIGFYMEDYVVALQAAYDKYMAQVPAVQEAMAMKAWLLAEKALYLDANWTITYHLNGGSMYTNEKAKITDLFFSALYQHLLENGFNDWVSQKHNAAGEVVEENVTHTLPSLEVFKDSSADNPHPDAFINLMKGDHGGYGVTTQTKDPDHFALVWLYKLYKEIDGTINADYRALSVGEKRFFNNAKNAHWASLLDIMSETYLAGSAYANYSVPRDLFNGTDLPVSQFFADGGTEFKYAEDRICYDTDKLASTATIKNWWGSYRHITQYLFNFNLSSGNANDLALYPKDTHVIPEAEAAAQLNDGVTNIYNAATVNFAEPVLVKPYSVFEGWYLDAELTQPVVWTVEGLGSVDVDVYAKFSGDPAHTNDVTIKSNPEVVVAVPYGDKLAVPAIPAPEGQVFIGLYEDEDLNVAYDLNAGVYGPKTLYPKYAAVADVYVVKFVTNVEGVQAPDQIFEASAPEKKAVAPAIQNPGFELLGWYKEAEFENLYNFEDEVVANMTLYAKWAQSIEVSFDAGLFGYAIPSQTLLPGEKAVEPEVDYEGYSVEGWYTEKAFENKFDFDVAPEANVKLYAKLVINAHTIKFTDRGEELAPFAGNYGAAIVFPADPVKEYYDFIGWYYENEEGDEVKFTALAMPDADYDLYSKFAATKYTISLEAPNYGLYGPDRETLIVDLLTEYHEFLGRTDSLSDFMHGAGNTTGYQGPWKDVKKFYKANSRYVDDSLGVFVSDARYFDKWVPFFDHIDALVTQINHQQSMWGSQWTGNIRLNDWICGTGTNMGAEPYVSMLPMVPAEIEYTVEDAVELPKISLSVPASTATFAGWYQLVEDELVKVLSFPVGTTGDMTLHAVFLSPEFEVQYYDGSTLLEKELLGVGQTISLVAPEKENAVFQGWFLDPALTEAYDASAVVAADLVLYAKFQPVTTTLTYEVNGGSAMAPDTGAYGREVPAPAAPTKIGYEFGGFFADAACTEAFVFPVASLEADATVYVKWIAKDPLTVSFDVISGTVIVSVTVEYGTELAKPEQDPAYEGRIFQGWFADAPCTEEFVFPVVVTEDVTIYAKWEMIQTKITYVENGGSEVADDTGDWGRIVAEPVITREGYTLDGWYEDELCTELHSFYQPVTEDIILYAKWSAIPIKVSFDAQGGTPVNPEDLDPIDTFYDELIAEPQGLTYENKVLEGWYTEDTFPAEKKFNFAQPIKETANFTLYAHWVPAPRTVTFNTLAEGVVVAPVVVPHGELLVAPTDPERYGYTFSAWFIDEALSTPYNFANPVVADMTLYAQWTVKQYDITFNDQYLLILTVAAEHDTYLTPPIVSPRTGFTFDGWFKDMEGSPDQEWKFAEDKVTEEMTLYGKWSIIQITLSFDSQGGSDVADMVQDYNTAFPAPADPTREGYTFEGWYEEPACTNLYDFETKLIADKELYAKWEVIPLTFTFNYDAIGEAAVDVATEYWAVIAEPAEGDHYPTPVGKTFEGYYVDALYSEAYDFTQQLKADTEVFAKYDIEQITLSFDSQGGSAVAPITQDYNTAFPEPEDPTWVGMVFEGWYEEPGCVNLYDFATLLTADKVLYADWSIQQTELSFNTTGGDPKAAMSGDYGRFIDAADVTDPTRAGHDFKGWYEELDLINPVTFPIEMTADKVIYAKWEIQMKKLTFNSNGGTMIADVIVPYGTVVVRPYDPERHHPTEPDYIFVDWYRVPVPADCQLDTEKYDFTQPLLADTIIYAHWHPDLTAWNTMLNELPEWADDNAAGTYTAMSWAAYKAKIELLEVEHLTYEAMEPLFAVVRGYRDDLFEPSEGASTPE